MGSGSRALEQEDTNALIELVEYWESIGQISSIEAGIAKKAVTDGENSLSEKQTYHFNKKVRELIQNAYNTQCLAGHSFVLHEVKEFLEDGCWFCNKNANSD